MSGLMMGWAREVAESYRLPPAEHLFLFLLCDGADGVAPRRDDYWAERLNLPPSEFASVLTNLGDLGLLYARRDHYWFHPQDDDDGGPAATPSPRPGWVYVMATDADAGPYKVGRAKNPTRRHREIQAMNGNGLHILRLWKHDEDYIAAEKAIHAALDRWRHHGEWFRCSLEDIDMAAAGCEGLECR